MDHVFDFQIVDMRSNPTRFLLSLFFIYCLLLHFILFYLFIILFYFFIFLFIIIFFFFYFYFILFPQIFSHRTLGPIYKFRPCCI